MIPRRLRLVLGVLLVAACAARAQIAPLEELARFPRGAVEIATRIG